MSEPYASLDSLPDLLTSTHLAIFLSMNEQTVRHYLRSGVIPGGLHIGTKWYLPKKRLRKLIDASDSAYRMA